MKEGEDVKMIGFTSANWVIYQGTKTHCMREVKEAVSVFKK